MKPENIIETIRGFDIFSYCSKKELKELSAFIYWRTYRKGQMLFTSGDPRERIYFLLNGFVKLERMNEDATLLYSDYVKPNTLFPYGGLFSEREYFYSATAVTDVEMLYIPTFYFEELIKKNNKRLLHIVKEISRILRLHESRLQRITKANATDRVIHTIGYLMSDLGNCDGDEVKIDCPITTTDLSHISGTSRETVSHVISDLRKNHVITFQAKKMTIHNQDFFEEANS